MKRWILLLRLYRLAAWLYETYRLIAKPRTEGALVALWHQGRVLLVAASYRRELSLPGGWINRGESAQRAAQRELAEELRLELEETQWGEPWVFTEHSARGVNTVWIFALELAERPALQVDGLEIMNCVWLTLAEALQRPITGHLREYLEQGMQCNQLE
jgi:ADP-ribose pyrophosphatase YjhB (NUDIX family)